MSNRVADRDLCSADALREFSEWTIAKARRRAPRAAELRKI